MAADWIYRTKASPYWQYDFVLNGRRFYGSTRSTSKPVARKHVERLRNNIITGNHGRPEMTLDDAAGRYWSEHGQHRRGARTIDGQLATLIDGLGAGTFLSELGSGAIADYVAKRRSTVAPKRKKPPTGATINRELAILRALMRRARRKWEVATAEWEWRDHRQDEPAERRRYLSPDEEEALFEALDPDLANMATFSLLTGVRLGSACRLRWRDVSTSESVIRFRDVKSTRNGETHELPLVPELSILLDGLRGHHPEFVFTYTRKRAGEVGKGGRQPFTRDGWRRRWAAALAAACITDFRWHDLRHSAATRLLKATGNLALCQAMLGHRSISTTRRYAHVQNEDLAAGMRAMSRTGPETRTGRVAPRPVRIVVNGLETEESQDVGASKDWSG